MSDTPTPSGPLDAQISRRELLALGGRIAALLCLAPSFGVRIADAMADAAQRPPVVWLNLSECTGCTESFIKMGYPTAASVVLEILSIDYHETIMAPSGHAAEKSLADALEHHAGSYIAIMEGAIPMADNGSYLRIGGRTGLDIAREVCDKAAAVITVGSCAFGGGIAGTAPNPSQAMGIKDALGLPTGSVISLPGCPVNPEWLLAVVVQYLLLGKLPALDDLGRPTMIYGELIHDLCERRAHFDAGRFVEQFGSEEAKLGYCLYRVGCKGPVTHANCPTVKWNDRLSWCVSRGAPCMGCAEANFPNQFQPFYDPVPGIPIPGFDGVETTANQVGMAVGVLTAAGVGAHLVARLATGRWGKGQPLEDPTAEIPEETS